jgi:hypothetical protein
MQIDDTADERLSVTFKTRFNQFPDHVVRLQLANPPQ